MGVRDGLSHTTEPKSGQGAEKLQPGSLRLGRLTRGAKHLATAVGVDSHHYHLIDTRRSWQVAGGCSGKSTYAAAR